jgi:hypothetical protein
MLPIVGFLPADPLVRASIVVVCGARARSGFDMGRTAAAFVTEAPLRGARRSACHGMTGDH